MIYIYKFTNVIINEQFKTVPENTWHEVSNHTQQVDADAQLQRFIDSGIPVEQLKIVSDDSDPNAPIVPPEQPSEEPQP